jgi:hypothetical protein
MNHEDVGDEMFASMEKTRDALVQKFQWFTHDTPVENLPKIMTEGLRTHRVSSCPDTIVTRHGQSAREVTCLRPDGTTAKTGSSGVPPFVRLAVNSIHLPAKVTLDWSYEWRLVCDWRIRKSVTWEQFVIEIVTEWGSLAIYETVKPSDLLIMPAIGNWLPLVRSKRDDVLLFK